MIPDLAQIPKVELHCHLECAFRHETLFDIAKKLNLDLPTHDFEKFKKVVLLKTPESDLKTALGKFLIIRECFRSEEFIGRLAYEYIEDAYQEGVKVLELRYSPSFIQGGCNFEFEKIHDLILSGVSKAKEKYDLEVGLIGIIGRNDPMELANKVCDFIIKNRNTFVGIDLADNEQDFDCKPFASLFKRAKDNGMNITIHAGEAIYPGSTQSVIDAINILGADRIGHGIQIVNDKRAQDVVIENDVILEVCPTSNYLTSSVASLKKHPIKKLMDSGVKVCINSDDPGIFDCPLLGEYEVLVEELGFTYDDFVVCNRHAFEASFISDTKLSRLRPFVLTNA